MTTPTAQSGPSDENASWDDAYERARKLIAEHCPDGRWITGPNTLAMALASEFEQPPAGARDALLSDTIGNLRRMASDEFSDCNLDRLNAVIERLESPLTGKADGGCKLGCADQCKAETHGVLSECPDLSKRPDAQPAATGAGGDTTGVLVCAQHGIYYAKGCASCEQDIDDLASIAAHRSAEEAP